MYTFLKRFLTNVFFVKTTLKDNCLQVAPDEDGGVLLREPRGPGVFHVPDHAPQGLPGDGYRRVPPERQVQTAVSAGQRYPATVHQGMFSQTSNKDSS